MKQLFTPLFMGFLTLCCHTNSEAQPSRPSIQFAPGKPGFDNATQALKFRKGERTASAAMPAKAARTTTSTRISNACNLVPNPSFDYQILSPLTGFNQNVYSLSGNNGDELGDWMSTNGSSPDYYATNAPAGSDSNPASAFTGQFTPNDYDPSPNAHNGTIGLLISPGGNDQEYITLKAGAISIAQGDYYASFYAYQNPASKTSTYLGLDLRPSANGDPRNAIVSTTYPKTSTSMESPGYVTGNYWAPVSGIIKNVPAGNYYVNIGNTSPAVRKNNFAAYYLIDDIALYKIPTAGPNIMAECDTSKITIGQGCDIPYATYAWTVSGSSTVFAKTIQTKVRPAYSTTYILTVTLPNGSQVTYSTLISMPPSSIGPINGYYNYGAGWLDASITAVPGASQYNWYRDGVLATGHGTSHTWWGRRNECGSPVISVEAVLPCGISPRISQTFQGPTTGCTGGPVLERTAALTAYPNPASETIMLPADGQDAVLLNANGKAVRQANQAGSISVQDLPDGLYNLQMRQNGKLINQRVQVKH